MPRRPLLVAALLTALVVTLTGCTVPVFAPNDAGTGGVAAPPAAAGDLATWNPCPDVPQQLVGRSASGMTYECASVAVPTDWNNAQASATFTIAMIRIRSRTQQNRIGSLVINPGGPGGSGIETAVYRSFGPQLGGLPTEVTDRFDLVGFDPRGVGRSAPVKCISDADQDATFAAHPDPADQAAFDRAVALNRKIADGCTGKYRDQLHLYSTEQAARDMDAVRAAVGDPKLTYLGYSYGTLLGATYAQLFPAKARALVLDGAIDPEQDFVAGSESQAKGFERAYANFGRWCAANGSQCPIGPDGRGAVTDAMAKAEASPVRGKDGREVTPGWIFVAVISSLYTELGWQQLAKAVAALRTGDAEGILDLADQYAQRDQRGRYTNLFDANLAVNCADSGDSPPLDRIRQLQGEWRTKYPMFGAALAVGMLPCAFWTSKRDPYPTGPATGAPPIVVVGTTGDPATPYENTAGLAAMLGVGRVLTWEGEGHTAYPNTPCITTAVDRYLIDLTVPPEGQRCPAR